jgi:threonylcarbamoyladenosine tRNA methylthiotransferase MtaB
MQTGASEVVLSGIHLGRYGSDLDPIIGLEDLLSMLLDGDMEGRLRLSSIEPLEITTGLAKIMAAAGGRICRHIHVPMQSGSDRILKAMGRPYRRDHFCEALSMLRESVPGIGIGCDVICGFPTETEEDFNQTRDLIEEFRIPFVHAFPYSPRPGTRAASLADDVPHRIKKERVRHIIELAADNRKAFAASFVGSLLKTAMEKRVDGQGRRLGLSDNYLQIAVKEPDEGAIPGRIIDTLIERMDGDVLEGHWVRTRENG